MAVRSSPWKRTCSDTISWRQDQALNATIYILRETGPTGFLLKEEGENKKYKVFLGDPHSCTCQDFKKEKEGLCKHICWVILRKFRVPRQNPITWQLGFVDRELNEILRGLLARQDARPTANARKHAALTEKASEENGKAVLEQRDIGDDDVCPICQDELLAKRLPVTYCKFGCGNSVHIKCMKVWADHQKTQGKTVIECPFCREDFGPLALLQQEVRNSGRDARADKLNEHLGITCNNCHVCPIAGKCYKCNLCVEFHLCQKCFNTPVHAAHHFSFRQRPSQRWRPAPRGDQGTVLPQAMVQNLQTRELSDQDYDTLLQLDSETAQQASDLTEETIRLFPVERVRPGGLMMAPGEQCRVCLRPYTQGEMVRKLPCRHKFHKECIDEWLLHRHPTCPVDGTTYTNSSVRAIQEANRQRARRITEENNRQQQNGTTANHSNRHNVQQQQTPSLSIPGVGYAWIGNGPEPNQQNSALERAALARNTVFGGRRTSNSSGINTNLESNLSIGGQLISGHSISSQQNSGVDSGSDQNGFQSESNASINGDITYSWSDTRENSGHVRENMGGFFGIFRNRDNARTNAATSDPNVASQNLTLGAVTNEIDTILTHSRASSQDGGSARTSSVRRGSQNGAASDSGVGDMSVTSTGLSGMSSASTGRTHGGSGSGVGRRRQAPMGSRRESRDEAPVEDAIIRVSHHIPTGDEDSSPAHAQPLQPLQPQPPSIPLPHDSPSLSVGGSVGDRMNSRSNVVGRGAGQRGNSGSNVVGGGAAQRGNSRSNAMGGGAAQRGNSKNSSHRGGVRHGENSEGGVRHGGNSTTITFEGGAGVGQEQNSGIGRGGGTMAKPPSGPTNEPVRRGGRVRRPLYREPAPRSRSKSQERKTDNATESSSLYIGHDPTSTQGFTSSFILSSTTAKDTRPARRTSMQRQDSEGDGRARGGGRGGGGGGAGGGGGHRWGETDVQDNGLFLSGNTLKDRDET